VHREYIPIFIKKSATLHSLFISGNCTTCFGWYLHLSSGAHKLYLQHLIFVIPLLLPAAIVKELELVWVCCGWRTHLCTWWLQYNRQVHRNILITLYNQWFARKFLPQGALWKFNYKWKILYLHIVHLSFMNHGHRSIILTSLQALNSQAIVNDSSTKPTDSQLTRKFTSHIKSKC